VLIHIAIQLTMPSQNPQNCADNHTPTPNDENRSSTTLVSNPNVQRPSEGWLQQPAWIGMFCVLVVSFSAEISLDGGVNPPRFYYSHEEIDEALIAAGHPPRSRSDQPAAQATPMPVVPEVPVPPTLSLVNASYYRTEGTSNLCRYIFSSKSNYLLQDLPLLSPQHQELRLCYQVTSATSLSCIPLHPLRLLLVERQLQ